MLKNLFPSLNPTRRPKSALGWKMFRGQSLVELGLTMPVLLLIVAGTVEVTNMITLYNQLQLATREAGRIAAQGAPDASVWSVLTQSLQQTPVVTSTDQLNVWVIRPSVKKCTSGGCETAWANATASLPWGVDENCVSKNSAGVVVCNGASPVTADMVRTSMFKINNTSFSEQPLAIVVARYDVQTLLNLKLPFPGASYREDGRFPVYAYTVFRQEVPKQSANQLSSGCSAYPIAISRSAIPDAVSEGQYFDATLNSLVTQGVGEDGFGFLGWRLSLRGVGNLTPNSWTGSLPSPGNSQYKIPSGNTTNNYQNPWNISDTQLRRAGWVYATTGISSLTVGSPAILSRLTEHMNAKRTLRVMVYEPDSGVATIAVPAPGPASSIKTTTPSTIYYNPLKDASNNWVYQISDFMIVRIVGLQNVDAAACTDPTCDPIKFDTPTNVVKFAFVKDDLSCGFPQ